VSSAPTPPESRDDIAQDASSYFEFYGDVAGVGFKKIEDRWVLQVHFNGKPERALPEPCEFRGYTVAFSNERAKAMPFQHSRRLS
jgi:hypothetical protein